MNLSDVNVLKRCIKQTLLPNSYLKLPSSLPCSRHQISFHLRLTGCTLSSSMNLLNLIVKKQFLIFTYCPTSPPTKWTSENHCPVKTTYQHPAVAKNDPSQVHFIPAGGGGEGLHPWIEKNASLLAFTTSQFVGLCLAFL